MSSETTTIPGYVAGTWTINPTNSDISFTVRHLGVSRVHGRFNEVAGKIVTGESIGQSSVSASIAAGSIDTGFGARDAYIKSDDVLAAPEHKELGFVSTGIRAAENGYLVDGNLTIRGVTRPVTLAAELGGFGDNPTEGVKVIGLSAATTLKRADFGLSRSIPSVVIGDAIEIRLDIQANLTN